MTAFKVACVAADCPDPVTVEAGAVLGADPVDSRILAEVGVDRNLGANARRPRNGRRSRRRGRRPRRPYPHHGKREHPTTGPRRRPAVERTGSDVEHTKP